MYFSVSVLWFKWSEGELDSFTSPGLCVQASENLIH